jgi:predicted ATP-dependent endonuclease of OLD family
MKGTLSMLAESSELVKEVDVHETYIDWVLDIGGRTVRSSVNQEISRQMESLILLELAGIHARHHARVEPTFLLIDELLDFYHPSAQIAAVERLQTVAEHAQVAIISHSSIVVDALSREWMLTALDYPQPSDIHLRDCPVDFEIETTTAPPTAFDPQ